MAVPSSLLGSYDGNFFIDAATETKQLILGLHQLELARQVEVEVEENIHVIVRPLSMTKCLDNNTILRPAIHRVPFSSTKELIGSS